MNPHGNMDLDPVVHMIGLSVSAMVLILCLLALWRFS